MGEGGCRESCGIDGNFRTTTGSAGTKQGLLTRVKSPDGSLHVANGQEKSTGSQQKEVCWWYGSFQDG